MSFESSLEYESERIGAAAIYCSDGRYGEQMDEFLHKGLALPRYDRVAMPGGAACLAGQIDVWREGETIARELRFLISSHAIERVVLIAHEDCGFYLKRLGVPASDLEERQREDLIKSARQIRGFAGGLQVDAYFAKKTGARVQFLAVAE